MARLPSKALVCPSVITFVIFLFPCLTDLQADSQPKRLHGEKCILPLPLLESLRTVYHKLDVVLEPLVPTSALRSDVPRRPCPVSVFPRCS